MQRQVSISTILCTIETIWVYVNFTKWISCNYHYILKSLIHYYNDFFSKLPDVYECIYEVHSSFYEPNTTWYIHIHNRFLIKQHISFKIQTIDFVIIFFWIIDILCLIIFRLVLESYYDILQTYLGLTNKICSTFSLCVNQV